MAVSKARSQADRRSTHDHNNGDPRVGLVHYPICSVNLAVWAVVVAQLVERSFLTSEIRSSNPNIGKVSSTNCN